MFGEPCPRQHGKGLFNLMWNHYYKTDGTNAKKAQWTCDGSPRSGQAYTLEHTYASCIDQNAARIFYATAAINNHIIIGADASNAFAETEGPKQEYYICPDAAFKNWWENCLKQEPIKDGQVIPILRNMQGHPEAPRLWSKHIHKILTERLQLKPTVHEPCLYSGRYQGQKIFLIQQVDDFAVSAPSKQIAQAFIDDLDQHLIKPLKMQHVLSYFNGINLVQTRLCITVNCRMYINRILEHHGWQNISSNINKGVVPMTSNSKIIRELKQTTGPDNSIDKRKLEKEMGFLFRIAICELIYAMVTCQPDLSFAVTKLSQYSNKPAKCHYVAVKNVFRYLAATKDEGLTYWRNKPYNETMNSPTDLNPRQSRPNTNGW